MMVERRELISPYPTWLLPAGRQQEGFVWLPGSDLLRGVGPRRTLFTFTSQTAAPSGQSHRNRRPAEP
jgi:hypothetical protein